MELTHRLAAASDTDAIAALMDRAIAELQRPFLNAEQIAASRLSMGLDTQLIADGTYFAISDGEHLVGCGGWSKRATLYGGNHSAELRDSSCSIRPASPPGSGRCILIQRMSGAGSGA